MLKREKVPIKNRVPAGGREFSKRFGKSSVRHECVETGKEKTGFRKLILGAIFALLVIQVVLANSMVTRGREISKLTAERGKLLEEISTLENAVAQAASLAVIRQKAEELGMGPGKIEFLPPPPLASAP